VRFTFLLRAVPLTILALLSGCQNTSQSSQHGMVATAHPMATEAAVEVLASGGNAADAAVAAAFSIAVTEPTMNSIGGRNLILIRYPDGRTVAYNGMTEVPSSYARPADPPATGYGTIATPGVVAALNRLHQEHGSVPWENLLEPAIRQAEEGFFLLPGEARRHALALDQIKDNPGFQNTFIKADGSTYKSGERLVQATLAKTLSNLASAGADAFYRGDIAASIAADMTKQGGHVSSEDLAAYQALDGRVITSTYRDLEIHSIAAPGGGGLVVKALNILENFDLTNLSEGQWGAVVAQALGLAVESMGVDYAEEDLGKVADKQWARVQAARIKIPFEPAAVATLGSAAFGLKESEPETDWAGLYWGNDSHHTTHFTIADCEGMTVSITQTLGPSFGSKVINPELGFVYAATMGSYLSQADQQPGSRPRTTIAPTVVTRDGQTELVLGAAGGLRILSAIVQTISRYVDQGKTLEQAVAAPRVHPALRINPKSARREAVLLEFHAETTPGEGWSQDQLNEWDSAGFSVSSTSRKAAFGRVHAVRQKEDKFIGVADPDWEGVARAPSSSRCVQVTR